MSGRPAGGRSSDAPRPEVRVGTLAGALTLDLLRALDQATLVSFLAGRRWFGAKQAAPTRVTVHDFVPLAAPAGDAAPGDTGVAADAAVARLDVELRDGRVERYQLPLVVRPVGAGAGGEGPRAVLAILVADDGARALLHDGLEDEGVRRLITRGLAEGARYSDDGTSWVLAPLPGAEVRDLPELPTRTGQAEQSNSSVVVGDRAILKLYRKLEAGEHPDVEIARALATRTGFRNTPELLGTILFEDRDGAETVAGMLQRLVPGARDAWELALEAAGDFLHAPQDTPPNPFAGEMRELGRVTRALHEALATIDEPAFAPRIASAADVDDWAARVRDMLRDSTEMLAQARSAGRLGGVDAAVADAVLRRRVELLGDLDALAEAVGDHPGSCIRNHGDYHLGQVLKGADGRFMLIDFEGEPARLLAERRAPGSALRDVAGMLRSFAYAAAAAAMDVGGVGFNPVVEVRSARWERGVREGFLAGYMEHGAAGFLPASSEAIEHLLMIFEMEKVFYELAYELNNRPDWVWIPLRGVGRMLGSPAIPRGRGA